MSYNKDIGFWAECCACQHLIDNHWTIVARNFTCRGGELDIIAEKASTLVFVEVKYRRRGGFTQLVSAVSHIKRGRLCRAALTFLSQHKQYASYQSRFDVIGICGHPDRGTKMHWLTNVIQCEN